MHICRKARSLSAVISIVTALIFAVGGVAKPVAHPAKPPAAVQSNDALPPLAPPDMTTLSQQSANGDIRAQLRPIDHTALSSEIAGKIVQLPVREGDHFNKGDILVGFDCSVYRAQLVHSAAAQTGAAVKLKSSEELAKLNGISQTDLAAARSQFTMDQAESALNGAMVHRCQIAAPYSGRVSAVRVQRYSFVQEGTPLLEIYDDSVLELEMIVPSRWLAWLKPGYGFTMRVDEVARDYRAEVTRISASIDPVSQTVKIFGRIVGTQDGLLPGMSGTALLAPPQQGAGKHVGR